jgi:tetratricopeptide (TPR) repeat protein
VSIAGLNLREEVLAAISVEDQPGASRSIRRGFGDRRICHLCIPVGAPNHLQGSTACRHGFNAVISRGHRLAPGFECEGDVRLERLRLRPALACCDHRKHQCTRHGQNLCSHRNLLFARPASGSFFELLEPGVAHGGTFAHSLKALNAPIELDPNFAAAHAALGGTYVALGEPGLAEQSIEKAYELREHVSDREKFDIIARYFTGVTGDLEKATQTSELWARAYPRDQTPHQFLAYYYELVGNYDKAISENLEAIRLDPDVAVLYSNLMEDYTPVNRLSEAKATYRKAAERNLDSSFLHADLYVIAFLENDAAEMQRQIQVARDMPGAEDWLFSQESDTSAFSGRLTKARELSRRAVDSAQRNDLKEVAAIWEMNSAIREVEFGNIPQARRKVEQSLKLATTKDSRTAAALVLARSGDATHALALADALQKQFPQSTERNFYWLPAIRAAVQLDRGNPMEALKLLETTATYELGYPRPQLEGGSLMYPAYLRGQAFLLLHRGPEAAAEFQKFIDQRAAVVNCPLGALARLWLGRAHALEGDGAAARKSYQEFFELWKDADPDIPILRQAKSEFAKLR